MKKLILLTATLLTLISCADTTVMNNDPISDITYTEPAQTEKPSEESAADKSPKESTTEKALAESTPQPPENSESRSAEAYKSTDEDICILTAPLRFDTPQEYYGCGEEMPDCYILKNPPENAEISEVCYREGVYVSTDYYIPLDERYKNENLDEYEKERMTSFICQRFLYEDGEYALKSFNASMVSIQRIEVNGSEYYYFEEHSPYDPDMLVGYSVSFVEYGRMFYLHFPPLDTFENMTEYLEVVKAEA